MYRIQGNTSVEKAKQRFREEFGVEIEIYDSSEDSAPDEKRISQVQSGTPEQFEWGEIRGNTLVRNVEESFFNNYHVEIRILRPDGTEADRDSTLDSVRRAYERVGQRPPLAEWLDNKLREQGMKEEEVAEKAGVSVPTIQNILLGRTENPNSSTRKKIEEAIGEKIPKETSEDIEQKASVVGVGDLKDIGDPFDVDELDGVPGVYVLYDVSERPVYVGKSKNIQRRLKTHKEKKWFVDKIIDTASYIKIEDDSLRHQIEQILIKFLKSNAVLNEKGVDRGDR